MFGEAADAIDLTDQASIVEAARMDHAVDDVLLAASLASQAAKRADQDLQSSGNVDWGPQFKLWCEAVVIAPDADNLLECARAQYCSIQQATNLQPSREVAIVEQAQESLTLIRAGLEIAGGQDDLPSSLRSQLVAGADCLRMVRSKGGDFIDCPDPHSDSGSFCSSSW